MLSPGRKPRAFFAKMSGNTLSKGDLRSNSPAAFLRCRGPVDRGRMPYVSRSTGTCNLSHKLVYCFYIMGYKIRPKSATKGGKMAACLLRRYGNARKMGSKKRAVSG